MTPEEEQAWLAAREARRDRQDQSQQLLYDFGEGEDAVLQDGREGHEPNARPPEAVVDALIRRGVARSQGLERAVSLSVAAAVASLFAAIPAVIGYNRFSARVDVLMNRFETFSDELASILQRAAHARTTCERAQVGVQQGHRQGRTCTRHNAVG